MAAGAGDAPAAQDLRVLRAARLMAAALALDRVVWAARARLAAAVVLALGPEWVVVPVEWVAEAAVVSMAAEVPLAAWAAAGAMAVAAVEEGKTPSVAFGASSLKREPLLRRLGFRHRQKPPS